MMWVWTIAIACCALCLLAHNKNQWNRHREQLKELKKIEHRLHNLQIEAHMKNAYEEDRAAASEGAQDS